MTKVLKEMIEKKLENNLNSEVLSSGKRREDLENMPSFDEGLIIVIMWLYIGLALSDITEIFIGICSSLSVPNIFMLK